MFNNTPSQEKTFCDNRLKDFGDNRLKDFSSSSYEVAFSTAIAMADLSPVAVMGNALILVVIWKNTFVRTPFHILLSGLALTDLCIQDSSPSLSLPPPTLRTLQSKGQIAIS